MNCKLAAVLISAYIDSELDGVQMLELRRHLGSCAECSQELRELRALKRLLGSAESPRPSEQFEARLCERVMRADGVAATGKFLLRSAVALSVAAGAAVAWLISSQPRVVPASPSEPTSSIAFELDRDQAYVAGGDPLGGHAPIITVGSSAR